MTKRWNILLLMLSVAIWLSWFLGGGQFSKQLTAQDKPTASASPVAADKLIELCSDP